ncbi:MAG: ABC transporter substrate-binding protein, partial [Mucilaginibacter polytrichastri]|nr:ABC transporter substrate-binding protein [Mucilaginibacter polytrichastri]
GQKAFASFAQSVRRPVLSPLSASPPADFRNPFLITFTVPLEMHAREAALFAMGKLKPMRVFILRSGTGDELKYTQPFRQMVDSLGKKKLPVTEVVLQNGNIDALLSKMTTQGNNLVVMPGTGRAYIDATLRSLDKIAHRFPIAVIGHPSWEKLGYLNNTLLQRLQARITSSNVIDYKSPEVSDFVREYRRDYHAEPGEYAFKGFDAAMYFGKMVAKNGSNFSDDLSKQSYDGLANELIWQKTANGWVNRHVYVLRYRDMQLQPEE